MDTRLKEAIPGIIEKLDLHEPGRFCAFAGFDACIDSIVKAVKERTDTNMPVYFPATADFGRYLSELNGKSCGIELETRISKPGGNMTITANALGKLGVNTDCAGTFGMPDIHPVFNSLSQNCRLISIADTITATAIEFADSKVIFFDPGPYRELTWSKLMEVLPREELIRLLSGKQLVAFLNWSEIEHSSEIWRGFLDEVLPEITHQAQKAEFICDLSDCSRKTAEEIREVLTLIGRFRAIFNVTLSLNQNEAGIVARALDLKNCLDERLICSIYEKASADHLIIHRTNDALAFDGTELESCSTFLCKEPAVLTGGGDNFNAGYSFARLCGMDTYQSLLLGNAVSGYYVKTGISPEIGDLRYFLSEMKVY